MFDYRLIFDSYWFYQLKEYFFSVYQNTLFDLTIFCMLIILIFLFRNIYMKSAIRNARANLPLVIGGWGTRGKSSVERLKGAIINASGYSFLSKTTGCEAMFIHAHQFSKMREMFLFRPYDKATIWEQHHLTCMSAKMKCNVLLWECMGLTPAYVKILQHDWMKDDLSTITNTYPDHEDIQGPAGINIPEVMTNFIPKSSRLLTTEESMLPILENKANLFNTELKEVNWIDAGLITDDILNRFSYEEHPYNIALVLKMTEELGIEKDFALKEMADRVIPDIGVLKIYPFVPIQTRTLEFISGMSANERFGALSNWRRVELDKHHLNKDPNIWIMTVVNNRADRIPRSKVFARILVEDISADCHILIGSNLNGLTGYIKEAWDSFMKDRRLFQVKESQEDQKAHMDYFTTHCERLRIPMTKNHVINRLKSMLIKQPMIESTKVKQLLQNWDDPEKLSQQLAEMNVSNQAEIIQFLKNDLEQFHDYQSIIHQFKKLKNNQFSELEEKARKFLEKCFQKKIIVIWNYHATGNQVNHQIVTNTPPGLHNRIMMLQNIKGTGLDFVYSWQAWERCYHACNQLLSDEPSDNHVGLQTLSSSQELSILTNEYIQTTIDQAKKLPTAQNERFQTELTAIQQKQKEIMKQMTFDSDNTEQKTRWYHKIIEWIEAFQDASDAVKRTKKAKKIYKDLTNQRISHERAAVELKALYKRQKGGWLII
jgi:poly-gamma-glutamate synthase PgsB/CapB